jgi:hypothetical protein
MVVVDGYRALPASRRAIIRLANSAKIWRFRTCGRLYCCDALLQRLRNTSRTWLRHSGNSSKKSTPLWASNPSPGIGTCPTADQPHIRDGLVRGTTRARRDHRRVGAGEASDAVGADGVDGLWQSYRRQGGGQPPCQHQRARPRGGPAAGDLGQNTCMTFRCTSASRHADGPADESAC